MTWMLYGCQSRMIVCRPQESVQETSGCKPLDKGFSLTKQNEDPISDCEQSFFKRSNNVVLILDQSELSGWAVLDRNSGH